MQRNTRTQLIKKTHERNNNNKHERKRKETHERKRRDERNGERKGPSHAGSRLREAIFTKIIPDSWPVNKPLKS